MELKKQIELIHWSERIYIFKADGEKIAQGFRQDLLENLPEKTLNKKVITIGILYDAFNIKIEE